MKFKYLCISLFLSLSLIQSIAAEEVESLFPGLGGALSPQELGLLNRYYQKDDPEFFKGMRLLSGEGLRASEDKGENHALKLLLLLLRDDVYIQNDSITLAIVLAHNALYAIGDAETRLRMLSDMKEQFHLYREIIQWQRAWNVAYRLESLPVLAKAQWAYRGSYHRQHKKLTLSEYEKYYASIANIRFFRQLALTQGFANSDSLRRISQKSEWFVYNNTASFDELDALPGFSDSGMKTVKNEEGWSLSVNGVFYREDGLPEFNFQVDFYKKYKVFTGDCTTTSMMKAYFYKSMGIPAFFVHLKPMNHFFTAHYNPFTQSWEFFQKWAPEADDSRLFRLRYYRVNPHCFLPNDSKTIILENLPAARIKNMVFNGISQDLYEELFVPSVAKIGVKTDAEILASSAGLLKAPLADSSARDGDSDRFSDTWEVEHGFDPLNPESPLKLGKSASSKDTSDTAVLPALDGIIRNENPLASAIGFLEKPNAATTQDHSVKAIRASFMNDLLYVSVEYHNPRRTEGRIRHTLRITGKGQALDSYVIQYGGVYDDYSRMEKLPSIKKNKADFLMDGVMIAVSDHAEFSIPASYVKGYDTLDISYEAGRNEFYSKTIRLNIRPDELLKTPDTLFEKAASVLSPAMPANDYRVRYDIREFKATVHKERLICQAQFHNDVSHNPFVIQTIILRCPGETYFIQWNSRTSVKNHYWKSKSGFDDKLLSYDALEKDGSLYFIVDLKVIKNEKILSIGYSAGAVDSNGKYIIHGDQVDLKGM